MILSIKFLEIQGQAKNIEIAVNSLKEIIINFTAKEAAQKTINRKKIEMVVENFSQRNLSANGGAYIPAGQEEMIIQNLKKAKNSEEREVIFKSSLKYIPANNSLIPVPASNFPFQDNQKIHSDKN